MQPECVVFAACWVTCPCRNAKRIKSKTLPQKKPLQLSATVGAAQFLAKRVQQIIDKPNDWTTIVHNYLLSSYWILKVNTRERQREWVKEVLSCNKSTQLSSVNFICIPFPVLPPIHVACGMSHGLLLHMNTIIFNPLQLVFTLDWSRAFVAFTFSASNCCQFVCGLFLLLFLLSI